jgi:hypothetical protein
VLPDPFKAGVLEKAQIRQLNQECVTRSLPGGSAGKGSD